MTPKIAVYSICHNEEYMLPFYLEHYRAFATEITVIDNYSTDGSMQLLRNADVRIDHFESNNEIRDEIMQDVKNKCWKRSCGLHDWVIVVDIDELLYHDDILAFLSDERNKRVSVYTPIGYHMVCDTLPVFGKGPLCKQVRRGCPDPGFCNKPCLFNPNAIREINYHIGCHSASPVTKPGYGRRQHFAARQRTERTLKLLHYDYLTLEHRINKCQIRGKRQSASNKQHGWGTQYNHDVAKLTADYNERCQHAVDVC